ncbi:MAG: hypothetical protein KIT09_33945 [Bryobacteraceae bacterium]|nr:hypothetical protein [Bryobacteraceae bacterium]
MFTWFWIGSFVVLIFLAGLMGYACLKNWLGLLIDDRGRFSLNHLQLLMWTLLVLSTLCAAFLVSGLDPESLRIPQELLILMGISVGSATLAGAVKSSKDLPGSTALVARRGMQVDRPDGTKAPIEPKISQVFLEEEGKQADAAINITKFQNFAFTIVAGLAYVVLTLRSHGFPVLPEQVLWLVGISHSGYIGGKIPNKS